MNRSEHAIASGSAADVAKRGRIGVGWGAVFALPWLAFAILALGDQRLAYSTYLAEGAFLFSAPLLIAFSGASWAARGSERRGWGRFVITALVCGFALILLLAAAAIIDGPSGFKRLDASSAARMLLVLWGVASAWVGLLCAIVSIHQRLSRATSVPPQGTEAPATAAATTVDRTNAGANSFDGRRLVFALAAALGVPLLLAAPVIALLKYDARQRESANAILSGEIGKVTAQIGDLKDYERIRANLLTRAQILNVLEPAAAQTADLLHVVGRLPPDLQLRSLESNGPRVVLVVNRPAGADERGLADLLEQSGFRNVEIAQTAPSKGGEAGFATVTATSTRIDAK
jgi:hypothetical protein